MTDKDIIIKAANRIGLEEWQLDRGIVQIIKEGLEKYKYWDDIDRYIKDRLDATTKGYLK
jgi:hypothetical protein